MKRLFAILLFFWLSKGTLVFAQDAAPPDSIDVTGLEEALNLIEVEIQALREDTDTAIVTLRNQLSTISSDLRTLTERVIVVEEQVTLQSIPRKELWLERYQTLLTGVIAIFTALVGLGGLIWVTWYNAADVRRRDQELLDQKASALANSLSVEMSSVFASLREIQNSLSVEHIPSREKLRFIDEGISFISLNIYQTLVADIGLLGKEIATHATSVSYGLSSAKAMASSVSPNLKDDQYDRLLALVATQIQLICDEAEKVENELSTRFKT